MINIVGLGYGGIDDLTVGTLKVLKSTKDVFIRNIKSPIINEFKKEGIEFKEFNEFNELHNNIIKYGEAGIDAVYAVLGNPSENVEVLRDFINYCSEKSISYNIYSSTGAKEFVQQCLQRIIGEVKVVDTDTIEKINFSRKDGIIITNTNDNAVVNKLKLKLTEVYSEDIELYYLEDSSEKKFDKILLKDINKINGFWLMYIPENSNGKRDIEDLIQIVDILRGKNGCPWDKEQTHESIKKDIIEESYEVYDAIEDKNKAALIEELGDVLFQVIFHASLGKDSNEFNLLDVTDGISRKMIYRHPHVFGNINVNNTEEVLVNWDKLKKGEKNFKSTTDELNGVAKALPALIRAAKVQKKARKVGFDWDDVSGAIEKVREEINEVIDVYRSEKMVRIKEEIGDLLFSCVNVSRFLNVDAEEALNLTTDKFIKRFSYIEEKAEQSKLKLEEMSLDDMDKLWDEAKRLENK